MTGPLVCRVTRMLWIVVLPETHILGRLTGPRRRTWRWVLWWRFCYWSGLYRLTWRWQR